MKSKRVYIILSIVIILLLIPLIAMQFTKEVNWTLSDFVAAGILLLGTGFLFEVIIRIVKDSLIKIILILTLLILLFLIWIQLAVGIF